MAKNYFADEPMPTLFTPAAAPVEQPVSQGRIGDTIDSLQSGGLSALGGMFDFIGAQGLAQSLYSSSNDQQAQMSERGREALGQQFIQEDEQGNFELGDGATDLDTWLLTMANVAGQFAGTAVPGAGWASGAAKLASLGAKGKNIANIASMGATGGAAATGQGMEQARQEVQNMPDTLLADSPLFGDVLRGVHASQPELSNVEKWEAAKTALANKVAQEVRTDPKVLLANFGASAIGDPIIGKALTGARLAKSGALRSALAGFVTEGSTEAVQAGVQQLGVNQSLQPIDNRDEMQGVVAAGLNEGLAGGGFGAAAGGIGGLVNRQPKQQPDPIAEPTAEPAVDPVTEQMKASNPDLGEAMASMDQHSTNVKNDVDNLDIPTAARQAGFNTNAGAGQFGDFITSPSQESLQGMRNQTITDMVNDAVNNIGPTPDDRFSPIKSGVIVARNGKPFKSMKEARNSKLAREAKRQGLTVDVVPFDNGYGLKVDAPATVTNDGTIPQNPETITETNAQPTANIAGDPINGEWIAFNEQSETKNIPRAEMPQIKAENRGAMVNFMNARDISHEQDEVPASSLKPTQQEFSPAKVKKAMEFEGGNRSILVSNDGYVLDGHHQWLAAREKGEPVKVIRLNAPIEQLVPLAKEMPSTETQGNTDQQADDSFQTEKPAQQIRGSISAPKDEKSAPSAAPITETSEAAEQDTAPDMLGDSEPPLFDQEPNAVNFKDLKTVKERVEAFVNLQEGDTVIDHRGNKIGTVFSKPRKNARVVRIQKKPGDTDTFNIAALAGGGTDTVSALDNYNSNQATVKQPSSKPKPEAKPKPESKLDAAEEKLNDELQDLFGELKEAFNEQKGRLNSGIDPKIAFIVSKIGAVLAAKGIVKFAKWAKQLTKLAKANGIEQDQLKPYQKSAYASISADPVRYNVTDEVADTMDAPREIRALDVDAILSEEVSTNESKAEEATNGNWYLVQKKLFDGEYESDIDAGIAEAKSVLSKTSKGIRLFSKSKANKKAQGVNAEQAQEIANNFIKGLNGANGITVNILEDTATAEKLWRMSLDGATVKGAYSEMSNTVYVIAENIDSVADLKQTLAHETIAHGGLDTVIGKEAKQEFIDRIKKTKGRKAFEQYWKDANNDYWDMSDDVKAEEIFARFVENEPSRGEVKYWWNALKRFIRKQLDKLGVVYREDDELTAMREMLESIVKGFKAQREPTNESRRDFLKGMSALSAAAMLPSMDAKAGNLTLGRAQALRGKSKVSPKAEKFLREGNLKAAINEIAKSESGQLAKLAKEVYGLLPNDVKVAVNDNLPTLAHGSTKIGLDGVSVTLYTRDDSDTDYGLNGKGFAREGLTSATVLHESLHAVVATRYRSISSGGISSNWRLLDIDKPQAMGSMTETLHVWREFKRLDAAKKSDITGVKIALRDPDEFFVRALTDPQFQQFLADHEYKGKTLLDRFKDWVKDVLFGFGGKEGTVPSWLDAALLTANDLLIAMNKDNPDYKYIKAVAKELSNQELSSEGFKAQRDPMVSSQAEMAYSQSDKKFSRTADNDTRTAPSKIAGSVKKAFNRDRFEKSIVPEWDALNAQLRETDKTAGDKIKRQLSRWFMPGGNLPETVQQAKRGRDRDVAVHEFDVSMLVGKLNSAMKAAKINPDRLADEQWAKYHQFLTGENDGKALNQSERDVLLAMRAHIDGLTRDYVASVNNKLQQRLESEGIEDPKEIARLEKMLGNIGKYLNRSYKAFDDQKWFAKIPTNVIDDARSYLIEQHIENGLDQTEAVRKAQVTLNEIVKTGTAYDSLGAFISESKLGAKDLSSLIKRKNIAPEIRALLGEYADPRINYAKSVSKMSAMIANDKLLNTIRDMGINSFIFEKDDRPANATVQLAGEGSEVYAPLNGMWTTPEIKEAFEDAMGGERSEGWLEKAIQINGFIKYGKTVLSPTTAMRNVMSSYFFTVANGHFNQKYMKQAVAAFNAQVKGKVTDGESDYMKRLIKLGVVYDSANAGEMVKMMTDGKVSQMLEGKSGAAFENLRWLTDKATGFYRFGDDFWKIVGFENEKAALIRTGMAESDAEVMAAERIQDTYPTYSRVGKAGVWLSRFPLAGTFVSFPAEIIRTTGNMMKLAASELKSSDPAIRAMGSRRVVGISLASGGMFALGALTKAMFGVTDDEEDALRDLAPPWQKNSTFLYAGRDKDGNLRYFDMTFMDPYAYWKRPIEAMMRNQPVNEAVSSSLSDMVSPFLGTDISASKILEVVSNKKESGGQVYKENDTAIRKGADIAGHLALGLAPGAVNNAWRIAMAAGDVKRSTGKPYSLADEMLALAGFRSSTFDPKVGLYYRTFDFNSAIAEARKELSGVLRDPNKVSDDEISAAKERAKTKQEQAFKQMSRLIKAAETGGASRSQVVQIILLAGISKRNAGFLLRGQVPPVNLSDRSFESAVKRAQLIMDSETAREVRSRFNRIASKD